MADFNMLNALIHELGFSDEQKQQIADKAKLWDGESRAFDEAVKNSEVVTEQDLAIRINARDDDD